VEDLVQFTQNKLLAPPLKHELALPLGLANCGTEHEAEPRYSGSHA